MTELSQLLLYIPGIVIFLVGSGQVKNWLRRRDKNNTAQAQVIGCKHVVKKDSKDREIFNYYEVQINVKNPKSGLKEHKTIKSPSEYAKGQKLFVSYGGANGSSVTIVQEENSRLSPWVMMFVGALLIILVLEENKGNELAAMCCLALVLLGLGGNLVCDYVSMKRRGLVRLEGEIIDVHKRQISKETKIIKGAKYTYYPVVKYALDGEINIRHCNVNSSGERTFKLGDSMALYIDPSTQQVLERKAGVLESVLGVALTLLGVLVAASLVSVLLM